MRDNSGKDKVRRFYSSFNLYPLCFILSRELMDWPMVEDAFHRAIYLTGPTASGKTAVGVALARRLDAEVLALDSMTLYRGMNIGTAKPTPAEQGGIPHHLIDIVDPWESTSVSQYREWAKQSVDEVERRGKRALFVGGTALYLKALLRGLFQGPGADVALRQRLMQVAEENGDSMLHGRLAALDPATAARLHPHDRRRIIRALEVFELTGMPISTLQAEHDRPAPAQVRVFALDLPRSSLHDRINRRVLRFFDLGLVDEVRGLQAANRPLCPVAAEGIGYREVIAMLSGRASWSETIERVQARSRQFAKRQATWFRGLAEVRLVSIGVEEDIEAIASRIAQMIEAGSGRCDSPT
jgi:tRNA dimethylallyltransferase